MITLTREEAEQLLAAFCQSSQPILGYRRNELHLTPKLHAELWAEAIQLLRAKLSEPEIQLGITYEEANQPEPVAWACVTDERSELVRFSWETFGQVTPLYTALPTQPEPEPLGWIVMHEGMNIDELRINEVEQMGYDEKPMPNQYRVYISPPQREWVGLTDEEIMSLLPGAVRLPTGWSETVRAIEAKLKEKNT